MAILPRHLVHALRSLPAERREVESYTAASQQQMGGQRKKMRTESALRDTGAGSRSAIVNRQARVYPTLPSGTGVSPGDAAHQAAANVAAGAVAELAELIAELGKKRPYSVARPQDVNSRIVSGLTAIDALRSIHRAVNLILDQWPRRSERQPVTGGHKHRGPD